MALVYEGMACSICEKPIADLGDIVASTHFIADKSDPLWPFSDTAMHPECFATWELRESFVTRYNATMGAITWGNGTHQEMQPDGRIVSKSSDGRTATEEDRLRTLELVHDVMQRNADRIAAAKRQMPLCPYCGCRLESKLAKQCLSCGMDWHNPTNVVRR